MNLIVVFICVHYGLHGQVLSNSFQESCDFIYAHSNGLNYLSTTHGLYQFDGINSPEKIKLPGLDNQNIQSQVYPGRKSDLWFTTYNRIIKYNISTGDFNSYSLIIGPADTLHSNYYLFDIDTIKNILWIKSDIGIYQFNLIDHKTTHWCDLTDERRIKPMKMGSEKVFLSYYYTYKPSIVKVSAYDGSCQSLQFWKGWPNNCIARGIEILDSSKVLIAHSLGLSIGDIESRTLTPIFQSYFLNGVDCIGQFGDNSWLVSTKERGIIKLKWNPQLNVFEKFNFDYFPDILECNKEIGPVDKILKQLNGIIFLTKKNSSIFFFNPDKIKFTNFMNQECDSLLNPNFSYERLHNLLDDTEITANGSPYIYNNNDCIKSKYPYRESEVTSNGNLILRIQHPYQKMLYRYFKDQKDEIYASFLNAGLYKLEKNTWKKVKMPKSVTKDINFFYKTNDSICIASVDQEKLVIWNSKSMGTTEKVILFSGDIYSVINLEEDAMYLATEQGLARFNLASTMIELVDSVYSSPCYCFLADRGNNIWYSSSDGIFRFDPDAKLTTKYKLSDGVYTGFKERQCYRVSKDSLLFTHNEGIALIQPSKINLLTNECKIYISGLKINDLSHDHADTLNYCSSFITNYPGNTISFDIKALDLADPKSTTIQYRLEGYDKDWINVPASSVLVRYPNLPPGSYKLQIKGSNSDNVWSTNPKELEIRVTPPYWMTWWFLTLSSLVIGRVCYGIIRSNFKRKLEKKNQLLREQSLVIEKQQAVEYERTRIASEMHDDLGSGLTTIRYLSDKALTQAKDAEEAIQIKKIADHSNDLVRNMSEIIWAMNARFDNADSLTSYLRRYASEYLDAYKLPLTFTATDEALDQIPLSGERRRNIFLVFKETLHNTIKYSGANAVHVNITIGDNFMVHVTEIGGKGFDPEETIEKGNGIYNSRKRMTAISGDIRYEIKPEAMHIILYIPLQATQDVQT